MSTFLKLLPLELEGIAGNDIIEPEYKLEKDDRIIGEMSDTVRRLFTLGMLMERDAQQSALDAKYCKDEAKKLELETKAGELGVKSSAIKELMWIAIRDELNAWGEGVGVRKGFKVVAYAEGNSPRSFIERLLGGGL